jgi:hypothetical protein
LSCLAQAVLSGGQSLSDAYEVAKQRAWDAEQVGTRLGALKAKDSDLAELVSDEKLKLAETEAPYRDVDESCLARAAWRRSYAATISLEWSRP